MVWKRILAVTETGKRELD